MIARSDMLERCPYCEEPMEVGVLVGAELVHRWVTGDVAMVKRSMFPGQRLGQRARGSHVARVEGHRCRRCRRIILRY
jgi:hypothetical protein